MASDDIWILGIHMTKFGKHPDKDIVDLASEAALAALADGGVTMPDMGVLAAGNLMGGRRRHRPAAAEADRPDRHPRLQRGQRLRHRRHRAAHGDHGGQGRRVRHGPGRRRREAGRRRAAGRRAAARTTATPGRRGPLRRGRPVDGRIGTETMPGVFAQIGMEYGHQATAAPASSCSPASARRTTPTRRSTRWRPTRSGCQLEQIMGDVMIAYPNTRPMCSANCDGAAAAVVVSARAPEDAGARAAPPGGEGVGVGAHERPVGRGVPGAARRQHAHPQRRHARPTSRRASAPKTSTWSSCTTASPRPSWSTTTT